MTGYDFSDKQTGSSGILLWTFAFAALFMFPGVDALQGFEAFWAESAREMISRGDYFHPAVNGEISCSSPLLPGWAVLPWIKLFGLTELAARIPGALAALAALWGTLLLAQRLFDRRTALFAGWLLVSCSGFLFWGRSGAPDMAHLACTVLAAAWFYSCGGKRSFGRYLLFWLIVFCGAHLKGLAAGAVPLLVLLPHLIREKRFLKELNFSHLAAFLLGALFWSLPLAALSFLPPAQGLRWPGGEAGGLAELVKCAHAVPLFGGETQDLVKNLYLLPLLLVPWTPFFLLAGGLAVLKFKKLYFAHQELLAGIVPAAVWALLCSSENRFFLTSLLPFCCIFAAAVFYREPDNRYLGGLVMLMRWLLIFTGACALAAPVMTPVFNMIFKQSPPLLPAVAVPAAGLLILMVCMLDDRPGCTIEKKTGMPHGLASAVCGAAIGAAIFYGAVLPGLGRFRTEKDFILNARSLLAGISEKDILFFRTDVPAQFLYYLQLNDPVSVLKKPVAEEKKSLAGYLAARRGRRTAFICYDRPREVLPLLAALRKAGADTAKLAPAAREKGKGKRWGIYLVDIPQK